MAQKRLAKPKPKPIYIGSPHAHGLPVRHVRSLLIQTVPSPPSPLPPLCCVDSRLQERLPWLVLTSIEILNELEVYLLNLGRYSYFTAV